jgi:hypothetical protein
MIDEDFKLILIGNPATNARPYICLRTPKSVKVIAFKCFVTD